MIEERTTIEVQNYILVNQLIRSGTRAHVYKGYSKEDESKLCAIKIIGISSIKKIYFKGEQMALTKLNNPHIMKLYEAIRTDNYLYMFLEYCEDGSLKDYLAKQPQQYLNEYRISIYIKADANQIIKQIFEGFKTLKSQNITHRDIRPSNILFHQVMAKITDFGFVRDINEQIKGTKAISIMITQQIFIKIRFRCIYGATTA